MALTLVNITGINTKAYAKEMVNEFCDLMQHEDFTGAAVVDPADGSTPSATATQLRNVIKEMELEDKLVVRIIDKKIHLIEKALV